VSPRNPALFHAVQRVYAAATAIAHAMPGSEMPRRPAIRITEDGPVEPASWIEEDQVDQKHLALLALHQLKGSEAVGLVVDGFQRDRAISAHLDRPIRAGWQPFRLTAEA
jgi:hypothetical protein